LPATETSTGLLTKPPSPVVLPGDLCNKETPVKRRLQTRITAVLMLVTLSACSGGGGHATPPIAGSQNSLDASSRVFPDALLTASGRKKKHRSEGDRHDGVKDSLLAGYAAEQQSAEKNRRHRKKSQAEEQISQQVQAALASGGAKTRAVQAVGGTGALVLYDNTGPYSFLGELYADAISNLAGHFGAVKAEPISSYVSGQVKQYAATIYAGSTYSSAITDFPAAFYTDIANATTPVLWMGDNIWNYANAIGPTAFETKYGWDATNSYFTGNATSVTYASQTLTRTFPAGTDQGVIAAAICSTNCAAPTFPVVTTLATAITNLTPATSFPWAVRSGNLTYIGEVPFAYVSESDRVIALHDLLFDALAPTTATRHRALVRLEDIDAGDDPNDLINAAKYLFGQGVPFSMAVIPQYVDPQGVDSGTGKPTYQSLAQMPAAMLAAIKYALTKGGTLVDHGYTHQYSVGGGPTGTGGAYVAGTAVNNPYDGISADDAEFFTASVNSGNYVVWNGPIPGDSTAWAQTRVNAALAEFAAVKLPTPTIWEFPHYFATDLDYRAVATKYSTRYERSLYFQGTLSGKAANYSQYIGQFFPYKVKDIYGTTVIPEDLGNYEPVADNNNPPRLPAQLVFNAQCNLAVRDGVASFFYHPYYGTTPLSQIVTGIKALGYTFVAAGSL
jgi:uncharacterized protein YdaL